MQNFEKFCRNIRIPLQRKNSTARLKIPWLAENWALVIIVSGYKQFACLLHLLLYNFNSQMSAYTE